LTGERVGNTLSVGSISTRAAAIAPPATIFEDIPAAVLSTARRGCAHGSQINQQEE